ncbi:hypothetical protein O3P69_013576 [Scylla paramamosain]|uniref:PDZ and LIM domain protein Zasp n=1 Tax=Scylla paramamosain TaxID=85552 RepID=A0AAW0SNP9_SCYPA
MSISTVKLSRTDGTPWGFRLQGGKDFATPLCVQKVNAGSLAAVAGLQAGDAIVSIGGRDALALRHKEAQEAIVRAGNNFDLVIQRGSQVWRPQVTPLAQVKTTPEGVPVATNTSLAANKKHVAPVGVKHNVKARPFAEVNGQQIVNAQYNTPLQLYSEDNIAETLSAQAEVLGKGCLGVNFMKNERAYDGKTSDVLRMVQEMDSNPVKEPEGYYNINEKLYCDVHAKQAARHHPPAPNMDPIIVKPGAPTPSGALPASAVKAAAPYKRPVGGMRMMPSVPAPAPAPMPKFTPIARPKPEPVVAAPELPPPPAPEPVLPPQPVEVEAPEPEPVPAEPEPVVAPPTPPPVMTPPPAVPAEAEAEAPAPAPEPEVEIAPAPIEVLQEPIFQPEPEPEPEPAPEAPVPEPLPSEEPALPSEAEAPPTDLVSEPQTTEAIPEPQPEPLVNGTASPELEPAAPEAVQEPEVAPEPQVEPEPEITEVAEAAPLLASETVVAPEPEAPPPSEPVVLEPKAAPEPVAPVSEPEPSVAPEEASIPVTEVSVGAPEVTAPQLTPAPQKEPAPIPAPAPAPIQVPAAPMAAPPPTFSPVKAPAAPAPQPAPFGAPAGGVDVRSHIPKKGTVMAAATTKDYPSCQTCNSPIRGPFVSALGKTWCPDHFVCSTGSCRKALIDMGFVEEQGALHCEDCYEKYLAPICGKCDKRVKGVSSSTYIL